MCGVHALPTRNKPSLGTHPHKHLLPGWRRTKAFPLSWMPPGHEPFTLPQGHTAPAAKCCSSPVHPWGQEGPSREANSVVQAVEDQPEFSSKETVFLCLLLEAC